MLSGGEILVNCKFKLNKNLNLKLYRKITRNSNPIKISIRLYTVRYREIWFSRLWLVDSNLPSIQHFDNHLIQHFDSHLPRTAVIPEQIVSAHFPPVYYTAPGLFWSGLDSRCFICRPYEDLRTVSWNLRIIIIWLGLCLSRTASCRNRRRCAGDVATLLSVLTNSDIPFPRPCVSFRKNCCTSIPTSVCLVPALSIITWRSSIKSLLST